MKKSEKIVKNILLAFVLISIGFVLGKHYAAQATVEENNIEKVSLVRVYYLHGNRRCASCNRIQELTEELLQEKYLDDVVDDKIEFTQVNFQKNKTLAKRFDIRSSCVVVADIKDGEIIAYQRLDKVWELFQTPPEFNDYVSKAIQVYLKEKK